MKVIKYIAIAAAALAIAGCSKWTEQEPVEVLYPTLKDKNPELYAQYMESLREYRASEHQVLIAKFDNKQTAPAGRADHIDCLPDSVDFVILRNPDNLSDAIIAEMKEIREEKGVKTLMEIDYNALAKTWEGILADEKDAKQAEYDAVDWESLSEEEADAKRQAFAEDPRGVDDTDRFIAWMGEQVKAVLAVADKYGYDGLNAKFNGQNPASLWEEQKAVYKKRSDAFFQPVMEWAGDNRILLFEGNPKNVVSDTGILDKALYIIVPCLSEQTVTGFNYAVNKVIASGVPTDKFVIGVTAIDVTDEAATDGYFSGDITAIVGAARWAVAPAENFGKKGICVDHAQFDYFNIQHVYSEIGSAISIMNPTPVK